MAASTESRTRYLSLQQDADFALWRSREANLDLRRVFAQHLAGQGEPPSGEQLERVRQLELEAEEKYRALRTFVREHFDGLGTA